MHWTGATEKDTATEMLEKRCWTAASDACASKQEPRRQFIEIRPVDLMVAAGPNMFYSVMLPFGL